MVFPPNFEQKLGFDSIRHILTENCLCQLGRQYISEISFSSDKESISSSLLFTEEFRKVLLFDEGFPSQDYYDMVQEILHIRIEGTYMEPERLSELKLSLASIFQIISFFRTRSADKYPALFAKTENIIIDPAILKKIEKIIDDRSNIRDDASPVLKKIRKEKASKLASVEKKIAQSLKAASKAGWTPDDAGVTVRNGRLVIPLLAKFKRQLSGFIHDESSTGQTVYMEPADVLETNNEIRELEYAERREIIRILIEFADFLRPFCDDLLHAYQFLGFIDFVRAKALFAISINGCYPSKLLDAPYISWNDAIHPLLYLSHSKQNKQVVPMTLSLNSGNRILVISGPNAGGKSVCLKTAGLLQYMLQCGLLPSAREDSEFGIFHHLFVDIGDEQSLENDLSTYTSKLLNMKYFLENMDARSLFLIDEFGTGTDPGLGGAMAEAALIRFNEMRGFGVVTTHYSNLKLLGGNVEGIINGAMLFDTRKMKPLYQLKTGKPGSSFAFEIANQIGFPKDVLKKASELTGTRQLDFDRQIQEVEVEKNELAKKTMEMKVADEFLDEIIKKYQKQTEELERSRKEILVKAREDAMKLFNDTNRLIEKTIKEIRESQADKEKTKKLREELNAEKEKLQLMTGGQKSEVRSQQSTNLIPSTSDPRPLISEANSQHPASDIQHPVSRPPTPYQGYIDDLHRKLAAFEMTLDLRGNRVDEALSLLQRYIDDAIILNISEVRILHGKGNGVLRQVTKDYLRSVKEVKSHHDEALERGGPGVTVVSFK